MRVLHNYLLGLSYLLASVTKIVDSSLLFNHRRYMARYLATGPSDESVTQLSVGLESSLSLEDKEKRLIIDLLNYFTVGCESFDMAGLSLPRSAHNSPLMERGECIAEVKRLFDRRRKCFDSDEIQGREGFILPVLIGLPGVGKSRLLDAYKQYFPPDLKHLFPLFVIYHNGNSVTSTDRELDIDLTFSARLLHRFLCENVKNNKLSLTSLMKKISQEPGGVLRHLDIPRACRVVRLALELRGDIVADDTLNLFLGVDEFQKIPPGDNSKNPKLSQLTEALLDASKALIPYKIRLYPLFAGTEWNKIHKFGPSSPFLSKVALPFLSCQASLKISHALFPSGLNSKSYIDCLFGFGGIPRLVCNFAQSVAEYDTPRTKSQLITISSRVFDQFGGFVKLGTDAIVRLTAFGICRIPVNAENQSGILARADTNESVHADNKAVGKLSNLTWQQLADRGYCQLMEGTEATGDKIVSIPYSLIVQCSRCHVNEEEEEEGGESVTDLFVLALRRIVALSSDPFTDPWRRWEYFGALYHAVRINSFLIAGSRQQITLHKFLSIAGESRCNCPDLVIKLRPAVVLLADDPPSNETDLTCIVKRDNMPCKRGSAVDLDKCYVFCNGGGDGEGVDIFFSLVTTTGDNVLLLDHRKKDSRRITTKSLSELTEKIKSVVPDTVSTSVSLIYSPFSTMGKRAVKFPPNCVAITRDVLSEYHGPFASCAVSYTKTNPNSANKSTLQQLLGCPPDAAAAVRARAQEVPFVTFRELQEFLQGRFEFSVDKLVHPFLLFVDDDGEESGDDDGAEEGEEDVQVTAEDRQ